MSTRAHWSEQVEPRLVGHIERNFTRYSLALLLAYDLALVWLYRGPSAVPDEWWFLSVAKQAQPSQTCLSWLQGLFSQMNVLGYGAAYWLIYRACIVWSADPLSSMRALGLLALVAIPASFLWAHRRMDAKSKCVALLLSLLWLTFPAAWWTGKVSGPEPLTMACIAFALARVRRDASDRFGPWVALGFACGLKLTCLPAVLFAAGVAIPQWRLRPRLLGLASASFVAGFVLANPCLLAGTHDAYVATLQKYSHPQSLTSAWHALPTLFFQEQWTWDLLPSQAFFYWGLQKLPFAILLASALGGLLSSSSRAALVASFVAAVFMMATNSGFLGWYWFPTLVVLVASLLWTDTQASRCLPILITCLCGNAIAQAPHIAQAITMKKTHDALLQRKESIEASLQAALHNCEPIDFVFDLSDVDLHLDFSILEGPTKGQLQYYEPRRVVHYIERIYKAPRPCGRGLIVLGERFLLHPRVQEVPTWLATLFPTWRLLPEERTSESMRLIFVDAVCTQQERDAPPEGDTLLQP